LKEKSSEKSPKKKFITEIYKDWCKRCGICAAFCIKSVLEQDDEGYPIVVDQDECVGCDFYSIIDTTFEDDFLQAVSDELKMRHPFSKIFDTFYVGGGTPSIIQADNIALLIETANNHFNIAHDCEFTIEINPGTVKPEIFKQYRQSGINRINMGVQSFFDSNLEFLGRIHSAADAVDSIDLARASGFENIGLDLIYGLPGQTVKAWLHDLTKAVELSPEHLSCYMLTYEPGTPVFSALKEGKFNALKETEVLELFETTMSFLKAEGYEQYEVSNFAKKAPLRSRHNQKYWSFAPYLGLGPSAHSYNGRERWWNHTDIKQYINDLGTGRLPVAVKEILSREQQMIEAVYLGLRRADGILVDEFNRRFEVDCLEIFGKKIMELREKGKIVLDDRRISLTEKGMMLLDSIVSMLIDLI